jgi:hypothetical protein
MFIGAGQMSTKVIGLKDAGSLSLNKTLARGARIIGENPMLTSANSPN